MTNSTEKSTTLNLYKAAALAHRLSTFVQLDENQKVSFLELSSLVNDLQTIQEREKDQIRELAMNIEERKNVYSGVFSRLKSLIQPISAVLKSASGTPHNVIQFCNEMRDRQVHINDISSLEIVDEGCIEKSKQSYGSIAEDYTDLVDQLRKVMPKSAHDCVQQLATTAAQLNGANSSVSQSFTAMNRYRHMRAHLTEQVQERIHRILSSAKETFGHNSREYGELVSITH